MRLAISVFAVAVTNKCTPTCAVIPYCNTRDFKTPFGSQRFVVVCGTNFEQQALLSSTWIKVCVCARACVRQQRLSQQLEQCSENGQTSNPGPSEGEQRAHRNVAI